MRAFRRRPPLAFAALEDRTVPVAGALDPAFSGGSPLLVAAPGDSLTRVEDTVVGPDGSVYAAGWGSGQNLRPIVFKVGPDGIPDATFNGTGYNAPTLPTVSAQFYGVARQPDGKLIASGTARI